jgi:hypothetical protein
MGSKRSASTDSRLPPDGHIAALPDSHLKAAGGTASDPSTARTQAPSPLLGLNAELNYLFVNTLDPQGQAWTLASVATEAARLGVPVSRSYIHALLTGRIKEPSLHKVQVLGLVFGVGSLGLVHPLEPEIGNEPEQDMRTQRVLRDLEKRADIIQRALTDARLQQAVLLLDGYESEETLEQATRLIAEIGDMEKRLRSPRRARRASRKSTEKVRGKQNA